MPFENVNDPLFFYYSSKHKEALARMSYAIRQKKLGILLIGEYGTGKTFLSRVLKKAYLESKYQFIYITNPRLSPLEFIREIYYQLGGNLDLFREPSKMELLHFIQKGLEDQFAKRIHVVIVIDEAQSIQEEGLLEEIRLLLNIQGEESAYFTLVLLGQPQVEQKVENIPQLKQRLSIRFKLFPLTDQESREYVERRLKVAGATRTIFVDSTYPQIYALSKGMPRAINNICDLALLGAFIKNMGVVDRDTIVHVGEDLGEFNKKEATNNTIESHD